MAMLVAATRADQAMRLQIALDRAGFSPGLIDGVVGRKTQVAAGLYRRSHAADPALPADVPTTLLYTLTAADLADVGDVPRDWNLRAQMERMTYESVAALLAERGHCTIATVRRLNPDLDLEALRPGSRVVLPNVLDAASVRVQPAASITIDLGEKTVSALDEAGRVVAVFHCSIAQFAEKRPTGSTAVKVVAFDPEYTFDPAMWPEVSNVRAKLRIPPGPRNPVGLAWVGLNLPGYGIHGTPWPELIGKTGSHGCIRLANWDAVRLARMVRIGLPVRFVP
jgi:lipoprotein-anchoring transpeptidase ErfK/SrfK